MSDREICAICGGAFAYGGHESTCPAMRDIPTPDELEEARRQGASNFEELSRRAREMRQPRHARDKGRDMTDMAKNERLALQQKWKRPACETVGELKAALNGLPEEMRLDEPVLPLVFNIGRANTCLGLEDPEGWDETEDETP